MRASVCRQYRRNLRAGATLSLMAYSTAAIAQTFGWTALNDFPKQFFGGASFTVLAMAFAGTLLGLGYTRPLEKRKSLFFIAPANTVMSAWALVILQDWGYLKVSDVILPPLAGIVAAFGVVLIPLLFKPDVAGAAIKALKEAIARFFNRAPPGGSP